MVKNGFDFKVHSMVSGGIIACMSSLTKIIPFCHYTDRVGFPKVGIRKHNIIKLTKIFHGMVHHLISHRNDLKMFKMQVELGTTGE